MDLIRGLCCESLTLAGVRLAAVRVTCPSLLSFMSSAGLRDAAFEIKGGNIERY